jgi:hypothetical protein
VTDGQASLSDANTLTWRGNVPANRPVTLNFAATIDELLASGDKIVNTAEGRWRAATESGEAKMLVASETGTPTPTPPASCPSTPTPRPTFSGALPNAGSVEPRVAHCSDDAHERVDTSETFYGLNEVTTGGGPGGLSGLIPYTGAFLFRDVRIPRYARISSARLSLGAEYQSGVPVTQVIAGDNRGNSEDFTAYHLDINLRPRTVARIPWMLTEKSFSWTTSPDIAAIIQEIVNRGDWHPGNDIGIIIDAGPGADKYANWWAVEMGPSKGARLFVSYDGVNTPTPTSTFTATSTPSSTPTGTAPSPDSWVLYLPLLLR